MKRILALLSALVLLLTAFALPAFADDDPNTNEQEIAQINDWYAKIKKGSAKKLTGEPVYVPKLVVAVYQDQDDTVPACSLDYTGGSEEGYYGIPDAWLASSMSEAKSIVVIHRVTEKYGTYTGGGDALTTLTQITVVDLVDKGVYNTITAVENDPPMRTSKHSDAGAYEPEEALALVAEKLAKLNPAGDKAKYQQAEKLYKAKKYYSASVAYGESLYKDWRKKMKSCVQKWPKNKEIWRSKSVKGSVAQLVVQVNATDKNTATVVRIFKGGKAASYLFIGGSGKATAKLPAGTYTIKIGKGTTWYGTNEFFGKYGAYQSLLFNEGTTKNITLKKNYRQTITINVTKSDPKAEGVGSESEDWSSFSK